MCGLTVVGPILAGAFNSSLTAPIKFLVEFSHARPYTLAEVYQIAQYENAR